MLRPAVNGFVKAVFLASVVGLVRVTSFLRPDYFVVFRHKFNCGEGLLKGWFLNLGNGTRGLCSDYKSKASKCFLNTATFTTYIFLFYSKMVSYFLSNQDLAFFYGFRVINSFRVLLKCTYIGIDPLCFTHLILKRSSCL